MQEANQSRSPMDYARELVALQDELDVLEAQIKDLETRIAMRKEQVQLLIDTGDLPDSFHCNGRNIHIAHQIWASPADGDHPRLTEVLRELGLIEYLPSTVNTHSISAYVREFADPNEALLIEERLLSADPKPLDPQLLAALKVTVKSAVRVPKRS